MNEIRLLCDEIGCKERLTVQVRDEYGPWRGADRADLYSAASSAGWLAEVDDRDGMAFVHCAKHNPAAVR